VEKKTYDLCFNILERFNEAGILDDLVLIGSWSIYFYKSYFNSKTYSTFIRTRDLDFLIPLPPRFKRNLDVYKLVEDLGFLEVFQGPKGYMKIEHPDLTIEFLVPERGKGSDRPYNVPQLKVNAQPLRYLNFLVENVIPLHFNNLVINVPHPAAYALHKFIIFKRRIKKDKQERDIESALRVFRELIKKGEHKIIKEIFSKMHKKWQKTVIQNLKSTEEFEIVHILENQD